MKRIDDIIIDTLSSAINNGLSKVIKPDIILDEVKQLTRDEIEKLKNGMSIEAVILDVDDTIRSELGSIPQCNKEWLENLKEQIKICIVSNGLDGELKKYFASIGLDYIFFAHKPLKNNFTKACNNMDVEPEKVLVIGDRVIDAIYGGKRNNMKTAHVKRVDEQQR